MIGSKSEVLDQDQKTNKSVTVVFIATELEQHRL